MTAKLAARFSHPGAARLVPGSARGRAGRGAARAACARRDGGARQRRRDARRCPTRASGWSPRRPRPGMPWKSCRARPRRPPRWRFRACRPSPMSSWASCRPARASGGGPWRPSGAARRPSCGSRRPIASASRSRTPRGPWGPAAPASPGSSRSCTRRSSAGRCRSSPTTFRARGPGRGEVTVVVEGADPAAHPNGLRRRSVDEQIREALARGRSLEARSPRRSRSAPGRPAREIYARALRALEAVKPDPE